VRRLWNRIRDILDLVDPLGKYKDHRLYNKNVEAILKQVYECVLFLRWYADKGFAGILRFFYTQALHSYRVAQFACFVTRFLNEPRMLSTDSSRHSRIYGNLCKRHSQSIISNKRIGSSQQRSVLRKLVCPNALGTLVWILMLNYSGGRPPRPFTRCYTSLGGIR
jgi:hypothetical protein